MARDCRNPRGGGPAGPGGPPGGKFDAEYASLMNELGEGGGGSSVGRPAGAIEGGASSRPPWASGAGPDGQPGQPAQPTLAPWRDPNNWITPVRAISDVDQLAKLSLMYVLPLQNQRMAMQHHQQPYGGGGGPGGYPGGGGGGGGGDYPGYSGYPGYGAPGQQPGAPAGQWGAQQQPAAQGSQSSTSRLALCALPKHSTTDTDELLLCALQPMKPTTARLLPRAPVLEPSARLLCSQVSLLPRVLARFKLTKGRCRSAVVPLPLPLPFSPLTHVIADCR